MVYFLCPVPMNYKRDPQFTLDCLQAYWAHAPGAGSLARCKGGQHLPLL